MPRRFQDGDLVRIADPTPLERHFTFIEYLGVILKYDRSPKLYHLSWYGRDTTTGEYHSNVGFSRTSRYHVLWYPPANTHMEHTMERHHARRSPNYWYQTYNLTYEVAGSLQDAPEGILDNPLYSYVRYVETLAPQAYQRPAGSSTGPLFTYL